MAEKQVKYYSDEANPVVFEWSTDGLVWHEVEHYDEQPTTGCKQATVDVESGWVRARLLLNNPELFSTPSNLMAVPEPGWVGVALGVLLLVRWGRGRSGL
jgi:hypothetical protein